MKWKTSKWSSRCCHLFELICSFLYKTRIWKKNCSQWAEFGLPVKRSEFLCPGVRSTPENPPPQGPRAPSLSLKSIQSLGWKKVSYQKSKHQLPQSCTAKNFQAKPGRRWHPLNTEINTWTMMLDYFYTHMTSIDFKPVSNPVYEWENWGPGKKFRLAL